MEYKFCKSLLLGLLAWGISCSVTIAASGDNIGYNSIVAENQDNPIVNKTRYKIRGTQEMAVAGIGSYSFFVGNTDCQRWKDGSVMWLIRFAKQNSDCNGDIILEYNASNFKTQLTEICRVHGTQSVDFEQMPHIEQVLGLAKQYCDPMVIKNLGEK